MKYVQSLLKALIKNKRDLADELIQLEDLIMKEYGFVAVEKLRKEPIPRIMNLMRAVEDRYKKEAREHDKMKRKIPKPRKR